MAAHKDGSTSGRFKSLFTSLTKGYSYQVEFKSTPVEISFGLRERRIRHSLKPGRCLLMMLTSALIPLNRFHPPGESLPVCSGMDLPDLVWRYNIYRRYSLLAFTGAGKAFQSTSNFNAIDWAHTIGTGFRYEIARSLGTHTEVDFAWGNAKDFAFYIVFGSSWF